MTNETVSELPIPADPEYLVWLRKEDYKLETTVPLESDATVWVRPAKYGSPKCSTNGAIMIEITKSGELFSMSIRASTPKYWGAAAIYGFEAAALVKQGRQFEHRIVDAWREMSA